MTAVLNYFFNKYDRISEEEMRKLQNKRLKEIVAHAYNNTKFWRDWFDRAKVKPEEIATVDDLGKLPYAQKSDLVSRPDEDRLGMSIENCVQMATSGTTGGPMRVYYTKDYAMLTMGILRTRARGWITSNVLYKGLRISYAARESPSSTISSFSSSSKRKEPRTRRKKTLGIGSSLLGPALDRVSRQACLSNEISEIMPELLDFKPDLIAANVSYLRLLAEYLERNKLKLKLKGALSTGEALDEPNRKFIESIFECRLHQAYGSNESGAVALECKERRMHIFSDSMIVEVIRDGLPVPCGEPGEIVVTGLLNTAMPLIRYKMGDIGTLSDEQCKCGRKLSILKSVEGRLIDHIVTSDNHILSPKRVTTLMHSLEGLPRCQLVQEQRSSFTLRVFKKQGIDVSSTTIGELCELLKRELGPNSDLTVSIEEPDRLKAKFRPVLSHLSLSDSRWTKPY